MNESNNGQIVTVHTRPAAVGEVIEPGQSGAGKLLHGLNISDVTAVAQVTSRNRLSQQQAELEVSIKGLEEQIGEINAAITKAGGQGTASLDTKKEAKLIAAISDAEYGTYILKTTFAGADVDKKVFTYDVAIMKKSEANLSYASTLFQRKAKVDFSTETKQLVKDGEKLRKTLEQTKQTLLKTRREIANLPYLATLVQAEIAKQVMENSDNPQTRALLERIQSVGLSSGMLLTADPR